MAFEAYNNILNPHAIFRKCTNTADNFSNDKYMQNFSSLVPGVLLQQKAERSVEKKMNCQDRGAHSNCDHTFFTAVSTNDQPGNSLRLTGAAIKFHFGHLRAT